ncbi:insulinase family protein, partial [Oleiphilus sp. HI0086]
SSNVNASLSIEKSPNDSRHYDYLVLENKLRVLLVSDPNTDKSSASLDVNIGSASDPLEYPGLAHFLEHMLFLGTEKFPEPDAYQKYITQHGGSHNAYTSPENTNYFFDIRPEFLEAALERFSEQFTHPLFNAEYVEREVNAVHSEYTSKVKDDGRRFYSVIKAVLADDHPYSRFSVGNLETLSDKGEEKLRDTLLEFYQKNYSANQMTLVILGKEPLSTLKKWTLAKFSNIPNSNVEFTDISQDFFAEDFLPVKVEAQSIMDKR